MVQPQDNLVSNLPLLFAGGYPTTLESITVTQLEKFIPFMVQCSLGLHNNPNAELTEPEWWPDNIPFRIPLKKSRISKKKWRETLLNILKLCYKFHKSEFLFQFCGEISVHKKEELRFVNNYNSTTSLFHRTTKKLLVTFRNENMCYDLTQTNNRISLLNKGNRAHNSNDGSELMVEPAIFDIYLCDTCDAELYSQEAYDDHEKVCKDDSVIICDSDDDDEVIVSDYVPVKGKTESIWQQQTEFLGNLNLVRVNAPIAKQNSNENGNAGGKARRSRGVLNIAKTHSIPFSSPVALKLLHKSKNFMSDKYKIERIEKNERNAIAAPIKNSSDNIKSVSKSRTSTHPVTYKRPAEDPIDCHREYKFQKRQYSQYARQLQRMNNKQIMTAKCTPCTVRLSRISNNFIKEHTSPKKPEPVIDVIDLCSSDDDEDVERNNTATTIHQKPSYEYNNNNNNNSSTTTTSNNNNNKCTNNNNNNNNRHLYNTTLILCRTEYNNKNITNSSTETESLSNNNMSMYKHNSKIENNQENLKHNIIFTNANFFIRTAKDQTDLGPDDLFKKTQAVSNILYK